MTLESTRNRIDDQQQDGREYEEAFALRSEHTQNIAEQLQWRVGHPTLQGMNPPTLLLPEETPAHGAKSPNADNRQDHGQRLLPLRTPTIPKLDVDQVRDW